jgi:polyisoprenoid-binding protein YceI
MLRLFLLGAALALGFALPAVAGEASTNPQSAPKGAYEPSKAHSLVTFCIRHLDISTYCGWFPKLAGKLKFNGAQPGASTVDVTIDLAAVQTRSAELDQRLRDEMFEVTKFPTATFKTNGSKVTGPNQGDVEGNLTLHGVTKAVILKTTFNGGRPSPFGPGYLIGFSADATIKLADFGLAGVAWKSFVGDEVTLHIETEFVQEN